MSSTINAVNNSLTLQTGTGLFVGDTTPTLVSPTSNNIKLTEPTALLDSNGNAFLGYNPVNNSVNYIEIQNANSGIGPVISVVGSDANILLNIFSKGLGQIILAPGGRSCLELIPITNAVNFTSITQAISGQSPAIGVLGPDSNIGLTINSKGTTGVNIRGSKDASNASSGYVGEVFSAQVLFSSAITFTSGSPQNLTSINLTAGDWDVYGSFGVNGSTLTNVLFGFNSTSTTLPDFSLVGGAGFGANICIFFIGEAPTQRINISSPTTIYLVGQVSGTGTITAYGNMFARRVR
jgi:hypothetical protein